MACWLKPCNQQFYAVSRLMKTIETKMYGIISLYNLIKENRISLRNEDRQIRSIDRLSNG